MTSLGFQIKIPRFGSGSAAESNPLERRGNYSATSNDIKFVTLAVDGRAVTFGIAGPLDVDNRTQPLMSTSVDISTKRVKFETVKRHF